MNRQLYIALSLLLFNVIQASVARSLNCGNNDPDMCKKEFVVQLDQRFQDFHVKTMTDEINEIVKVFNAALGDLPTNDPRAKMLKTSVNELKADAKKLEANRKDYEKTRELINHIEMHIQPHIMLANLDKKSLAEMESILDKHNYRTFMENLDFNVFIDTLTNMWIELHAELRPSDLKEYPEYDEINEQMKKITAEKDQKKKEKLLKEAVIHIRKFCKIPFWEEVIFYKMKTNKQ